jgi:putative polymerase
MSGLVAPGRAEAWPLQPAAEYTRRDLGPPIVVVATCFNMVLCFINARHWAMIGTSQVIAVQLAILAAVVFFVRRQIGSGLLGGSLLSLASVAAFKLFNPAVDLKILYDLALIPAFMLLGTMSSISQANRLVHTLLVIVVMVGLFELLFPQWFGDLFDVWGYYTNKGVLDGDVVNYRDTKLFVSGERSSDTARTLLPGIFGAHRVSSVFLEPVSMGNFPIICLAWFLSIRSGTALSRGLSIAACLFCIVLPDSRFAMGCSLAMVGLRLLPWHRSTWFAGVLPCTALVALVIWGTANPATGLPEIEADDFAGRLLFSGRLLSIFTWADWLALAPSPNYVADTGYAYLINNAGLPLVLGLWLVFLLRKRNKPEALTLSGMLAAYISTSLCVGASMFSIKTGALCWFLYGAATAGAGQHSPRNHVDQGSEGHLKREPAA